MGRKRAKSVPLKATAAGILHKTIKKLTESLQPPILPKPKASSKSERTEEKTSNSEEENSLVFF